MLELDESKKCWPSNCFKLLYMCTVLSCSFIMLLYWPITLQSVYNLVFYFMSILTDLGVQNDQLLQIISLVYWLHFI